MVLCFMVSSTVIVVFCVAMVLIVKYVRPTVKEDFSIIDIVRYFKMLSYRGRCTVVLSPILLVLAALVWRVWELLVTESAVVNKCNPPLSPPPNWAEESDDGIKWSEEESGVLLSEIMPKWFAPFWVVSDYELHIAAVQLRLSKLMFLSAFIFSIPFILMAVGFISNMDKPLLRLTLWAVEIYRKWTYQNDVDQILRLIYVEYMNEQYLKTIVKSTLAGMEKEKEAKDLGEKIEQLQKNIAEMNKWMDSERRLANNFDKKNKEVERKLASEKLKAQTLGNRCQHLEKKIDSEKKATNTWERKFIDLQKKLALLEKRPTFVKQQLSDEDIMCVVCMERKRQYLIRPCNHYCVCKDCKSTLQNKCPLCRKLIRSYEKIYIS